MWPFIAVVKRKFIVSIDSTVMAAPARRGCEAARADQVCILKH